jgi:hypothetical protein
MEAMRKLRNRPPATSTPASGGGRQASGGSHPNPNSNSFGPLEGQGGSA